MVVGLTANAHNLLQPLESLQEGTCRMRKPKHWPLEVRDVPRHVKIGILSAQEDARFPSLACQRPDRNFIAMKSNQPRNKRNGPLFYLRV